MAQDKPAGQTIPPATFTNHVLMLASQAAIALGQAPNPATGKTEKQIDLARHFIDTLALLKDKTQGNLDAQESQLLETAIHQLRLAYVEAQR